MIIGGTTYDEARAYHRHRDIEDDREPSSADSAVAAITHLNLKNKRVYMVHVRV